MKTVQGRRVSSSTPKPKKNTNKNSGPGWTTIRTGDKTHVFADGRNGYRMWVGAVSPDTPLRFLIKKAQGIAGVKVQ